MARRRMLAPINTIKHFVQNTSGTIANGAIETIPIVVAVATGSITDKEDVTEGAIIKAVYIERWLAGDSTTDATSSQFILTVEKKRTTETDMTNAQSLNLAAYPNKKNILYTTQGIVSNEAVAAAVPVIRQYFLIPKGKQRFGLGDQLVVNISAIITLRRCGFATYKEYI